MMKWITGALVIVALTGCNTNNITQDNSLKQYFEDQKVDGCFGMFDNALGEFIIYNMPRYRDSAFLPASTFKIFNSLVALGTGRIFSDTVVLPWDGVVRTGPRGDTMYAWNKSMNMREAFAVSCVPFYQELARRIGRDTMQKMLDSISYGNKKIGPQIDRFWLDNSLKITPDEQLGLVKRLYFRQLAIQNREQEIVKDMMIREKTDKYILAYKTGWGQKENGSQLGWMVGWIEENKHPYFFVLNLESPDKNIDMVGVREKMLKGILKKMGFFEGRK
jgi:beta-lactamase class D